MFAELQTTSVSTGRSSQTNLYNSVTTRIIGLGYHALSFDLDHIQLHVSTTFALRNPNASHACTTPRASRSILKKCEDRVAEDLHRLIARAQTSDVSACRMIEAHRWQTSIFKISVAVRQHWSCFKARTVRKLLLHPSTSAKISSLQSHVFSAPVPVERGMTTPDML